MVEGLSLRIAEDGGNPQWFRSAKNQDVSTGLLACPFACAAHSFACSTLLALLARSAALIRSLARFAHSLARGKVNDWMSQNYLVLSHSAPVSPAATTTMAAPPLHYGRK